MIKKGSIALARLQCVQIVGFYDEEEDMTGSDYGSVDIAEILSAEIERLRSEVKALQEKLRINS